MEHKLGMDISKGYPTMNEFFNAEERNCVYTRRISNVKYTDWAPFGQKVYKVKWDDIKDKNLAIQDIKGKERPVLYQYPHYSIELIAKWELDMSEYEFLMYATGGQCELFIGIKR